MSRRPAQPSPAPSAPPPSVAPEAFWVRSVVRLSRNLAGRPFPAAASPAARRLAGAQISRALSAVAGPLREVERTVPAPGLDPAWVAHEAGFDPEPLLDGKHAGRASLPEARLLLPRTRRAPPGGIPRFHAVANSRNHLTLCANAPGDALPALWREVSACDDALSARLPYAFSPEVGYLLANAAHLGNGLHAYCVLHLPATRLLSLGGPLVALLADAGYELCFWAHLDAEPENPPGALCTLSPKGCGQDSEASVVDNLRTVARHVCEREAATLARLREKAPDLLLDVAVRAAAVARVAVRADPYEALDLLSDLRLAALLGQPGIPSVRAFYAAALRAQPPPDGRDPFSPEEKLRLASVLRSAAPVAAPAPSPRKVSP